MTKAELRTHFRAKRRALPPDEVARRSDSIAQRTVRLLAQLPVRWLHVFLPIQKQNEVDTWLIVRRVWHERPDLQLAVPRVDERSDLLTHHALTPATTLRENRWGISEPPLTDDGLLPSLFDAVLVPLLAFDEQGHRVGYGGGYYDRFLAHCRPDCHKIGLSLFDSIERIDDVAPTDVRLDICITPDQTYRWLVD